MKITTAAAPVKSHVPLLLAFDVAKRSLTLYSQHQRDGRTLRLEDELPNATRAIEHVLRRCAGLAAELGLDGVTVLCESTGGYEQKLLQTARRLGHQTALINPEHVAGYKVIESNDTGKTDQKDPRVMHLLARMGKTLTHRHLPERYRRLRRLVARAADVEEALALLQEREHLLVQAPRGQHGAVDLQERLLLEVLRADRLELQVALVGGGGRLDRLVVGPAVGGIEVWQLERVLRLVLLRILFGISHSSSKS